MNESAGRNVPGGSRGGRYIVSQAAFGLGFVGVYLAATHLGLLLRIDFGGLTPLWPASGVALVLLIKRGLAWWPLILAGELATAWSLGQPWTMGMAGGLAESTATAIAVLLLRHTGTGTSFRNVADTVRFCVIICLLPPVVGAAIGTAAQLAHGLVPASSWQIAWLTWWLGDAMGLLVVTPLLMTWWPLPFRSLRTAVEWLCVVVLFMVSGAIVTLYTGQQGEHLFFLLLPFVGWLTLRFGAAGASSAAAVLAALVFGLSEGAGRFDTAVYIAFVGTSACMGYLLAAVLNQHRVLLNELRHRADHDDLTGRYSRPRLESELRRLIKRRSSADHHALINMDLDHFNVINDTCGHEAGDRILKEAGERLAGVLPDDAVVARTGGDEFGILVTDTDAAKAEALGESLRRALLDRHFVVGEYEFVIGASIGVALFDPGEPASAVMSRADIACHAAKADGRDRVHLYSAQDLSMQRHYSELEWVSQFRRAMSEGQLVLFAQRIVPVSGGEEAPFYEVLLRKIEDGEPVSPGKFLPVAARYGLMPAIDRWVIAEAFRFIARNQDKEFKLSINLAAASLDRPHFVEYVEKLVEEHAISPGRVCFEVTEQIAIYDMPRALQRLEKLRDSGFEFALDDFGSGVASFGYLDQLPVQYLKIDGQFVRALDDDPASRIIVSSLKELTALRKMRCVAEWVESEAVMLELRRIGVDLAQGYHIHVPEPLERVLD